MQEISFPPLQRLTRRKSSRDEDSCLQGRLEQRTIPRISHKHSQDDPQSYCGDLIASFPAFLHGSGNVLVKKIDNVLARK
jgi:hypothetical protein